MTSQNQTQKDATTLTSSKVDAASNVAEPKEVKRHLTDEEIAAVIGAGSQTGGGGAGRKLD
jgi:hypothetical protein